jgi:protein-S-isoprenylcysteine O-methyltransferase Ste14
MTDLRTVRTPSSGRALIIPGAILVALGVIGIITYASLAATETPGAATGQGAIQGGIIVVSALLVGVGLVLLLTGIIKARRNTAGAPDPGQEPRNLRD